MIKFRCPSCTASITVDETYAGRQGKCPRCKAGVIVPAALTTPQPLPTADTPTTRASSHEQARASMPIVPEREQHKTHAPPQYIGLSRMASLLEYVGILFAACGFVMLLALLNNLFADSSSTTRHAPQAPLEPIIFVVITITTLITASVLVAMGHALHALRDIARNSWSLPT